MKVSAVQFKATCLKLIDRVAETGESVLITKRGRVLARLVPDHGRRRGFGKGRGTVEILCSDEALFRLGAGEPGSRRTPRSSSSRRRLARVASSKSEPAGGRR